MGIQKEYTITVDRHSDLYQALGEAVMLQNFDKLLGGYLAVKGLSLIQVEGESTTSTDDFIHIRCLCETQPNPFFVGFVSE